jgi:hypothetical protein
MQEFVEAVHLNGAGKAHVGLDSIVVVHRERYGSPPAGRARTVGRRGHAIGLRCPCRKALHADYRPKPEAVTGD